MDTILGATYSLDDLREATEAYVAKRTKSWLGVCWYKPDTALHLEWDDETLYQVGEMLSCPKLEAECILKLLKAAGTQFVFATYTHEEPEKDNGDDEEEFDEEGWLVGSDTGGEGNRFSAYDPADVAGNDRRYLGVLSPRGLRLQTQTIFHDGLKRVFFPAGDVPILAEYAVNMSEQYEGKHLRQIRFLLKLQIYYLVTFCVR